MRRALLLLPALLLPACGDGSDVQAEYVEQASAVCERAVGEFEELTTPTTAEGFAPYASELVGIASRAQEDLSALTPPPDDREELQDRVLEPFADLVAEGREYVEQVEAAGNDQAALLGLLAQRPSTEGIDVEYLRSYGLDACAEAVELAG